MKWIVDTCNEKNGRVLMAAVSATYSRDSLRRIEGIVGDALVINNVEMKGNISRYFVRVKDDDFEHKSLLLTHILTQTSVLKSSH